MGYYVKICLIVVCYELFELVVCLVCIVDVCLYILYIFIVREFLLFDNDILLEEKRIIVEVCVLYLLFDFFDYLEFGVCIKCNFFIKIKINWDVFC